MSIAVLYPMADHRFKSTVSEASSTGETNPDRPRARRAILFGGRRTPETARNNLDFVKRELTAISQQDAAKWNFNFSEEKPEKGRYQWEKIDAQREQLLPEAYRLNRLPFCGGRLINNPTTSSVVGGTNQREQIENNNTQNVDEKFENTIRRQTEIKEYLKTRKRSLSSSSSTSPSSSIQSKHLSSSSSSSFPTEPILTLDLPPKNKLRRTVSS